MLRWRLSVSPTARWRASACEACISLRRRRGETLRSGRFGQVENRSWRPFQLAFILLSIPALADPKHNDRTKPLRKRTPICLWFPTGGGKTEAYLGVAAFTMAIRRLAGKARRLRCGPRSCGHHALHAAASDDSAIPARHDAALRDGNAPRRECGQHQEMGQGAVQLGLWVGNKVTPGTTEQSHEVIEAERDGQFAPQSTPAQLTFCPWCGSEIRAGRDIHVDRDVGRTAICCGDKLSQCEFSQGKRATGLPVVVVDEEIYHRPPTMLIGTVDKFAMMAWRGETRTLFGRAKDECPRHGLLWPDADAPVSTMRKASFLRPRSFRLRPLRPPDLIIQDEFHLISGPLGTMVGLYETAIDELSAWKLDDKIIRPKIIASTATVRKAEEQVKHVFLRQVAVFPPHGLDIEDNFFSVQRSVEEKPGRLYLGICSPGSSRPAVLIRLYVALAHCGAIALRAIRDCGGPLHDAGRLFQFAPRAWAECGGWPRTMCRLAPSACR